jgi:hypothetical protein
MSIPLHIFGHLKATIFISLTPFTNKKSGGYHGGSQNKPPRRAWQDKRQNYHRTGTGQRKPNGAAFAVTSQPTNLPILDDLLQYTKATLPIPDDLLQHAKATLPHTAIHYSIRGGWLICYLISHSFICFAWS